MPDQFDEIHDVVVIGSGAGGMSAAITAAKNGLDVVLLEKSEYIGGSTAVSGPRHSIEYSLWTAVTGNSA